MGETGTGQQVAQLLDCYTMMMMMMMMDWKDCRRKRLWSNFRKYLGILLAVARKSTKYRSQDSHLRAEIITRAIPNTKNK
jgi:Zn-dependent M32 family carboxypeptidase